ncbi:unnamed protein product [Prunus brigantina]
MSRRWIQNPNRCADEYLDGIEDFIEFARRHNPGATRIRCPCRRSNNTLWETIENVGFHLVRNGMVETYSIWNLHGEQLDNASSSNATRVDNIEPIVDPNEQVMDIINDAFPFASTNINQEGEDDIPTPMDSAEFEQYKQLLKSANQELYPGCESFSDPGRSIDVYLRPLVDELKDLWTNGVRTYDKATGKMFTLRAAVMWTVNDFPAYAMVSGWSTKGYMACPVCKENLTSGWHAGKVCYLGHRRWLSWDHEWREKDKEFDGNTEHRLRPRECSGDEILEQLNRLDFSPFRKTLPYWSKLKLRHNLDVMHVEKNVFDTLVGTILDIEGKTKDTIKARLDLERMGIRRGLWMNRDGDKARRDLAFFAMKPNDKKDFLQFVSSVKFPDGYASNITRCVNVDGG